METFRIRYLDGARMSSIAAVREFMDVGLREASELIDTQGVILERVSAAEARRVADRFSEIGAQVEVERTWRHVYAFDPRHPARGDQALERLRAGEREVEVDRGALGLWEHASTDAVTRAERRKFVDPTVADRHTLERILGWERAGLAIAESELAVLQAVSARDPTLEAVLRECPDDPAAHAIYGDWLQAAGDPRGQLVALQLALNRLPKVERPSAQLARHEEAFRAEHAGHLFGPLRQVADKLALRWSLGFVDAAFVGRIGWSRWAGGAFEVLAGLLALPVAARLQELGLASPLLRRPELEGLLAGSEVVAHLRALELGDRASPRGRSDALVAFSRLWPRLRRLRRLRFHGFAPPLRTLHSATLEHLELFLPDLDSLLDIRDAFIAGRLPKLQALTLAVDTLDRRAPRAFADALALPDFAGIRRLELRIGSGSLPYWLAAELARTPRVAALDRLDLSACTIDTRARALLEQARARGRVPALALPGDGPEAGPQSE